MEVFKNFLRGVEVALVLFLGMSSALANEAPRGTPWPPAWSSGNKQAFGTSYEAYDEDGTYSQRSATSPISHVWFTAAQGVTSEIFWPTIDRKQLRDMQFLVSDARGFFFEERTQSVSRVSWIENGVPAYRILTSDPGGRFEIEKILFTDPTRDAYLIKARFRPHVPGLRLYVLANPSLANTPSGDSAVVDDSSLSAWQDLDALSLMSSVGYRKTSAGFSGSLDPYQQLLRTGRLDHLFTTATDGDVVMAAELALPEVPGEYAFNLALGFSDNVARARETAGTSLSDIEGAYALYVKEWRRYAQKIPEPRLKEPYDVGLFRGSVAILKSLEDKTFPGAFVASPAVPWGLSKIDNSRQASPRRVQMTSSEVPITEAAQGIGAYHLVWPRDLYQISEAFIASGDLDSAKAGLRYLEKIQYKAPDGFWSYGDRRFPKEGSLLQNCWVHGEAYWKMLQIDQTSYPILLALDLWKLQAVSFDKIRPLLTTAADFIETYGPWTFQDRWEENMGVAPSTLAVQIQALRGAAAAFTSQGDASRGARYLERARQWDQEVEAWTYTTSGEKLRNGYYLRIVGTAGPGAAWNPNSPLARIQLTNGGPSLPEKSVIDGGFLELVRYGVRKAWDSFVTNTVDVYDSELRFETSRGTGFKRYTSDGYNWDEASGQQTAGMIWPLLSGERARYELASLQERSDRLSRDGVSALYDSQVLPYLRSLESFATPSGMFPEQVWDSGPAQGLPTGSATPLGWGHADYVRLLRELEHFENRP